MPEGVGIWNPAHFHTEEGTQVTLVNPNDSNLQLDLTLWVQHQGTNPSQIN